MAPAKRQLDDHSQHDPTVPQLVIALPRLESSGSWCMPAPNIFRPRLRASVSSKPSITTLPRNGAIKSNKASPARPATSGPR